MEKKNFNLYLSHFQVGPGDVNEIGQKGWDVTQISTVLYSPSYVGYIYTVLQYTVVYYSSIILHTVYIKSGIIAQLRRALETTFYVFERQVSGICSQIP